MRGAFLREAQLVLALLCAINGEDTVGPAVRALQIRSGMWAGLIVLSPGCYRCDGGRVFPRGNVAAMCSTAMARRTERGGV